MAKLAQLEAYFIQYYKENDKDMFRYVNNIKEAHGINFICPKSLQSEYQHHVIVYFIGSPVPDYLGRNKNGKTVRWSVQGTGLHDLTLQPSIQEQDNICEWHGFVTNGEAN